MKQKPTQKQMFYRACEKAAEADQLFLEMVKDGMTRQELQTNINRRPAIWRRYSMWLDKLPEG